MVRRRYFLLAVYIILVLYLTVFSRGISLSNPEYTLFWSYQRWLEGDAKLGREILLNIAMFIPFGFIISAISYERIGISAEKYDKKKQKLQICIITALSILFSLLIETLQLVLMRGLFEFDDVFSNILGGIIGFGLFRMFGKWRDVATVILVLSLAVAVMIDAGSKTQPNTPRDICFQVSEVKSINGEVELTGFAFAYDRDLKYELKLGNVAMSTETGLYSPEVDNYFSCDRDYSHTGFRAVANVDDGEHEIILHLGPFTDLRTNIYVTGVNIHYAPTEKYQEPSGGKDLKEIVENGILRVFRPDYHCWVYQLGWNLYWIVDKDFCFEDDGNTYIQYQLWTTQKEKLPQPRLDHNWLWDNIGGNFEDYELAGDFGEYRVMMRSLPTSYSITSIVTGYYKSGRWIWNEFFRPIYNFIGEGNVGEE